jgi:hypothetical protein
VSPALRRRFLLVSVASASLGTGCLERLAIREGSTPEVRAPISGYEFSLVDPETRFEAGTEAFENRFEHAATAELTDETTVEIRGRLRSGSRSCTETYPRTIVFDRGTGRLSVEIFDDFVGGSEGCSQEEAVVPYTLTVSFEKSVVEAVTIEHAADGEGTVFSERVSLVS